MTELVYRVGEREKIKNKKRRRKIWICLFLLILLLLVWTGNIIRNSLKPDTTIKQGKAVVTKVSYDQKTKRYDLPDFSIELPVSWTQLPRPEGPYNMYRWQSSDRKSNGKILEVYEDTIPVNYAVNKVLIVEGQSDHLQLDGSISDNCATFTKNLTPSAGRVGVPAKFQEIDFICDQANLQRDVIGTSSADGVNTVVLKKPTGGSHKFFFTYTYNGINPDYSDLYNALQSFAMQ